MEREFSPGTFRKADINKRRILLKDSLQEEDLAALGTDEEFLQISQVMVENAIGLIQVPLGIATGFLIDSREYRIPLATEEPSVIAAASYAASLISRHGGFTTESEGTSIGAQVYLEIPDPHGHEAALRAIEAGKGPLSRLLDPILARMTLRGGGLRGISCQWIHELSLIRVDLEVDVRDAMGANLVNSCAEALRPMLEELSKGKVIMAILSNEAHGRLCRASFSLPLGALGRAGLEGKEVARRICLASEIAKQDHSRAVTHNKGIMNGISALALATMNDTRGIEAAAHAWAARSGSYSSLSSYYIEEGRIEETPTKETPTKEASIGKAPTGPVLRGLFEAPLPFAVLGGAVDFHPGSRAALKILGRPDASSLSRIAAALGLAQNFAAVWALVSEGIQPGHMALHAKRLAYAAGARGKELELMASAIRAAEKEGRKLDQEGRNALLDQIRSQR